MSNEERRINDPLFRAIKQLFYPPGSPNEDKMPIIVNPGVSAEIIYPPPIASFIPSITAIPAKDVIGGEQYTVDCPFCGDTRSRLYISAMWNAHIKAGHNEYICSDRLLRCFNEECLQESGGRPNKNREWVINGLNKLLKNPSVLEFTELQNSRTEVDTEHLANQVPMPPHTADIEHPSVPEYIRKYWYEDRGFSAETLRKFGVVIAYMTHPIKRGAELMQQPVTIIPVYQYGSYWFYQARLIPINGDSRLGYERDILNDQYPKYYIPHTAKKSWTLYNLDNAVKYEEIAIVEGTTDVWRIGERAVAKFGRSLSAAQRGILIKLFRNKSLVLVPDMDDPKALEDAYKDKVILDNTGAFKQVRISIMEPGIDPGSLRMTEEEVWQYLMARLSSQEEQSSMTCGSLVSL